MLIVICRAVTGSNLLLGENVVPVVGAVVRCGSISATTDASGGAILDLEGVYLPGDVVEVSCIAEDMSGATKAVVLSPGVPDATTFLLWPMSLCGF